MTITTVPPATQILTYYQKQIKSSW